MAFLFYLKSGIGQYRYTKTTFITFITKITDVMNVINVLIVKNEGVISYTS